MKVLAYTALLMSLNGWAYTPAAAGPAVRQQQLVLLSDEPARVLACMPIETGAPIYLEFINSIYQAPVRETLAYTEADGFFITRVESPSAGVFEYYGLEPNSSGSAEMRRKVGKIRIRSSGYENHRLTAGNKTIHFKEIADGGEPLLLEIRAGEKGCGQ